MGGSALLWWFSVCWCSTFSSKVPRVPSGTGFAMHRMYLKKPRPSTQRKRVNRGTAKIFKTALFFLRIFYPPFTIPRFLLLRLLGVEGLNFRFNPLLPLFLCVEGLAFGCGSAALCLRRGFSRCIMKDCAHGVWTIIETLKKSEQDTLHHRGLRAPQWQCRHGL